MDAGALPLPPDATGLVAVDANGLCLIATGQHRTVVIPLPAPSSLGLCLATITSLCDFKPSCLCSQKIGIRSMIAEVWYNGAVSAFL